MTAKRILLFLLLLAAIACEERINLPLKPEGTDLLVVEGVLTNEKTRHRIRLSHPFPALNGSGQPAGGAIVTVASGNQIYPLTESPEGSGIYLTDSMIAVVGTPYLLTIQHQGKQYLAQDSAEPVEPLAPLQYEKASNPDLEFFRLVFNRSGRSANYVDHTIDWRNTGFCAPGDFCGAEIIFYDLKTTDVNEIYKPAKKEYDFPAGTTIIRKKYSASPAYKAFLRGILSETEWRGGIFDVERANAPTNLSAGAIGFFAVSTVVMDTTVVGQ